MSIQLDRFSLKNKRALITGASKGIGYGIAEAFAAAGAELILVARNGNALEEAQRTLRQFGTHVDIAPFDLTAVDRIHRWYDDEICKLGAPDVLVNNAGIARRGPVEDLSLEDWNQVLAVNLSSVFALSQAFGRERIASGRQGSIVNVGSIQTYVTRYGTAAYCATKGGIGNLTKGMAVDWAKKGIRVNAVAPGFINTPMTSGLRSNDTFESWIHDRCPQGRWGEPEDIGWPAVFLASDAAAFITGTTLTVDGGLTASM